MRYLGVPMIHSGVLTTVLDMAAVIMTSSMTSSTVLVTKVSVEIYDTHGHL